MSEVLIDRLVEFAESGNQQKIVLHETVYQGWIMEITDTALLISTGYSDKVGKDHWIDFADLIQAQLYYWNNIDHQWQSFDL
ncbi:MULTISPECIES: hypothetical protein [unclassified Acinetobacter]|uniref:hypothetical protein n=1 Tax=unclassified Acinetobacter TaxID=196816 RepID=UPI0029344CE9|nr:MULTISPECIES: hypothetical protein [unclassified Acinetobacter]WOE30794.1 hypothetical protein QSG84_10520 [Acinetobacter sp. SAAs470]WOE38988.1 hypothetical protein QSG86_04185 [Acinetobacter sp. SAAs474]